VEIDASAYEIMYSALDELTVVTDVANQAAEPGNSTGRGRGTF
jgi:hypothetical protein